MGHQRTRAAEHTSPSRRASPARRQRSPDAGPSIRQLQQNPLALAPTELIAAQQHVGHDAVAEILGTLLVQRQESSEAGADGDGGAPEMTPEEAERQVSEARDSAASQAGDGGPGGGGDGGGGGGGGGGQSGPTNSETRSAAQERADGGGGGGGGGGDGGGAGGADAGAPQTTTEDDQDVDLAVTPATADSTIPNVSELTTGGTLTNYADEKAWHDAWAAGGSGVGMATGERAELVGEALGAGAAEGLTGGLAAAVVGQMVKYGTKSIPYASGFLAAGEMVLKGQSPVEWGKEQFKAGGEKVGAGWGKLWGGDSDFIDRIEGFVDILDGLNSFIGTISTICFIVAGVLALAGIVLAIFGVGAALLAFAGICAKAGLLLGKIATVVGIIVTALRLIIMAARAAQIMLSDADPATQAKRADSLRKSTGDFAKDVTKSYADRKADDKLKEWEQNRQAAAPSPDQPDGAPAPAAAGTAAPEVTKAEDRRGFLTRRLDDLSAGDFTKTTGEVGQLQQEGWGVEATDRHLPDTIRERREADRFLENFVTEQPAPPEAAGEERATGTVVSGEATVPPARQAPVVDEPSVVIDPSIEGVEHIPAPPRPPFPGGPRSDIDWYDPVHNPQGTVRKEDVAKIKGEVGSGADREEFAPPYDPASPVPLPAPLPVPPKKGQVGGYNPAQERGYFGVVPPHQFDPLTGEPIAQGFGSRATPGGAFHDDVHESQDAAHAHIAGEAAGGEGPFRGDRAIPQQWPQPDPSQAPSSSSVEEGGVYPIMNPAINPHTGLPFATPYIGSVAAPQPEGRAVTGELPPGAVRHPQTGEVYYPGGGPQVQLPAGIVHGGTPEVGPTYPIPPGGSPPPSAAYGPQAPGTATAPDEPGAPQRNDLVSLWERGRKAGEDYVASGITERLGFTGKDSAFSAAGSTKEEAAAHRQEWVADQRQKMDKAHQSMTADLPPPPVEKEAELDEAAKNYAKLDVEERQIRFQQKEIAVLSKSASDEMTATQALQQLMAANQQAIAKEQQELNRRGQAQEQLKAKTSSMGDEATQAGTQQQSQSGGLQSFLGRFTEMMGIVPSKVVSNSGQGSGAASQLGQGFQQGGKGTTDAAARSQAAGQHVDELSSQTQECRDTFQESNAELTNLQQVAAGGLDDARSGKAFLQQAQEQSEQKLLDIADAKQNERTKQQEATQVMNAWAEQHLQLRTTGHANLEAQMTHIEEALPA